MLTSHGTIQMPVEATKLVLNSWKNPRCRPSADQAQSCLGRLKRTAAADCSSQVGIWALGDLVNRSKGTGDAVPRLDGGAFSGVVFKTQARGQGRSGGAYHS
jgi:hypothetical protein